MAIRDANVSPPLNSENDQGVPSASLETRKVTAMVSPSARPRASIEAEMTPGRPNGRTAVRIISHRVAPSASAPSLWVTGVWANTSRDRAVTIGSTMIDRTMPMKKMVPPLIPVVENSGNQPSASWSPPSTGVTRLRNVSAAQSP